MLAREPRWHRGWRLLKREWGKAEAIAKAVNRREIAFRPRLYKESYGYPQFWTLRFYSDQKGLRRARMASVSRVRAFGIDLSYLGVWRTDGGSSTPIRRNTWQALRKRFSVHATTSFLGGIPS